METTLRDFNTGKKVTCKNTGKNFCGKAVWVDQNGNLYERTSPNGRKCRLSYYFRKWNDDTAEDIRANVL